MQVFSIILRILCLGACGFAFWCWWDKKDLVAQKEAIIQEHELISGYYTNDRPKPSETNKVTQDTTTRKENFDDIREVDPKNASLLRVEEIYSGLQSIRDNDQYFGYKGKRIAEREAKKDEKVNFQIHILDQANKIENQKGIIADKNQEIEELTADRDLQKELLGKEITLRQEKERIIGEMEEAMQQQLGKYAQLKQNYLDEQKQHQEEKEQLQENLKTQTEELKVTLAAKEDKITEIETENQDLQIEVNRLMTQVRTGGPGTPGNPGGLPPNGLNPGQPPAPGPDGIIVGPYQPFKKHVQVIGFSEKNQILALYVGAREGLKETMKLRLLRNGSTLARLGLIKIDYQPGVSLFKVLQNSESTEWQTIASLKKGDAVTVEE